ncbi:signal peptidase I [Acutalibacter caecimuris]|uniref:signal peptidase I n=1 Tax=Acutalibacter caecimuris TaxID=3093657 RepID=UPI002AC9E879|nr:signal peptidase I [Acutalibacter sp. M00118]
MNQENMGVTQSGKPQRSFAAWLLEWVETIGVAFVAVTLFFTFFARIITVDGISMEPTYFDGDRVLVTSLAGEAQKGDIVIIVHALEDTIIKRVVATEGQWVDFDPELGELTVDGVPVYGEEFGIQNGITFVPDRNGMVVEFPQQVPTGCVFVLGDNRGNSTDSRYLSVGMVNRKNLLGKVVLNLYPLSRAGLPGKH